MTERSFLGMNTLVQTTPAMTLDDVKKGLAKLG